MSKIVSSFLFAEMFVFIREFLIEVEKYFCFFQKHYCTVHNSVLYLVTVKDVLHSAIV